MQYDYILLNVTNSDFTYNFPPNTPLILNEGAEVGVKNLYLWNTLPNISAKYNNQKLRVDEGVGFRDVIIPEGMYDIKELNAFLHEKFDTQIKLTVNMATFKIKLKLDDIKVDLTQGELYKLLGLEAKVYEQTEEGPNIINITRSVDRLLIRTNIVERRYQNQFQDVLYDILPVAQPGSVLHENIENVEFHRCKDLVIRQIKIRLTDDIGESLQLTEHMTLKLVFRH